MIRNSITKIIAILTIVSLNWAGLSAVIDTFAYFSDTAISSGNTFTAGTLDFSLSTGEWSPEEKAVNLQPGESVTRDINVIKNGSLGFQYNASTVIDTENSDMDFCNALSLEAELGGGTEYSGNLDGLNFTSPIIIDSSGQDDWIFTITLSSGYSVPEDGAICEFKFIFDAWQENLSFGQGFYDSEEFDNSLETGGSTTSGYSPIADAYINENKPKENKGGVKELQIRSEDGKNKETFIKFDFNFPSGTTIISSNLKLYMKSAPSTSRDYEARRVLGSWKERDPYGIDWNTQPAVDGTLTDSVLSGTTKNVWLSWDVTNDVRNFVNDLGSYPNYGWQLKDNNEDSSTAYEAKFHSRESSKIELRPILEVQFSVPEVATDHLVINEVYYHVGSGKGNDIKNEWVEIYNPTDSAVDISGWKICDGQACDTIPASSEIPSKGFTVITNKASTWDKWSIPDGVIKIVLNSAIGNGLANTGDGVELRKADNTLVDAMSYGSDTTYFELPLSGKGKSLARIIKGYDTDSATDWIINATPNPGTNPSVDGVETLIFTSYGVAVAGYEPVIEEDDSGEEEIFEEEPIIEENSEAEITAVNEATSTEATTTEVTTTEELGVEATTSEGIIKETSTTDTTENQDGEKTDETPVVQEQSVIAPLENVETQISSAESAVEKVSAESTEEIIPEGTSEEEPIIEEQPIVEKEQPTITIVEEQPAVKEQPVITPDNNSGAEVASVNNGSGGDTGGSTTDAPSIGAGSSGDSVSVALSE
jgi:predicted ribosomally synthesized peptide with SipW-like signal peptide